MRKAAVRWNRGFSLVEVTLALGILTVGLIVLTGLLPTGLRLVKESADEASAMNIMSAMHADIQSAGSKSPTARYQIPLNTPNSGKAFFDAEGRWLGNEGPYAAAVFAGTWEIRARNSSSPPTALITVSWPALAEKPMGTVDILVVLSQEPK